VFFSVGILFTERDSVAASLRTALEHWQGSFRFSGCIAKAAGGHGWKGSPTPETCNTVCRGSRLSHRLFQGSHPGKNSVVQWVLDAETS
jgi:hypothetical protein